MPSGSAQRRHELTSALLTSTVLLCVQVSVPHFRQQQSQDVPDPLAAVPRRRTGQAIQAAMAADAQQAWGQVPLPSGLCETGTRCLLLVDATSIMLCQGQQHYKPAQRSRINKHNCCS